MNDGAEGQFTDGEKQTLSILVDMIIPASEEYGVPGASDDLIFSTILSDAERSRPRIIAALSALDDLALEDHGAGFSNLSNEQRTKVTEIFRDSHPANANLIVALTTQCYYRDDRVVVSLGMEPRPPHPEGYTVEQGDWSLLDQMRTRAEFYRKA
jgi:hypothetical protein